MPPNAIIMPSSLKRPLHVAAAVLSILLLLAVTGSAAASAPKDMVIVLLKGVQPAALYSGGVGGLAATAARASAGGGGRIRFDAAAAATYTAFVRQQSDGVATRALGSTAAVLHRYTTVLAGFAAGPLTPSQVAALKRDRRVKGVFRNSRVQANTISTPHFLGLDTPGTGVWSQLGGTANAGEGVVVGVIDTGFWPEAPSFSDRADPSSNSGEVVCGPPPSTFRGTCQAGEQWSQDTCNLKLVACKYFNAAYGGNEGIKEQYPDEINSCRNAYAESHGTHVSSTAVGNNGVLAINTTTPPLTMSGIAPRARLSVYKVLWGPNGMGWTVDIVAAVDQATADGCDVINLSLGASAALPLFNEPVNLAYKNSAAAGVSVVAAAGNEGPDPYTLGNNDGPWITTVAASTHNRGSTANVTLGDGAVFAGQPSAMTTYSPVAGPLVLSDDVGLAGADEADVRRCFNGTLDPAKVAGRVVVCDRGANALIYKSAEVAAAGGIGMILVNVPDGASNTLSQPHSVPTVHLTAAARDPIRAYATAVGAAATASLGPLLTFDATAPTMASFSSVGPLPGDPDLLKPDITAPGVDIIAASSKEMPLWQISGTSMSSPHIAGVTALLAQRFPSWSPMMIKSAIMTTAYQTTKTGPAPGEVFGQPFNFGAGHVDPSAALNPGLVFDSGAADWQRFICGSGEVPMSDCPECAANPSLCDCANLNSPSIALANLAATKTVTRTVTSVLSQAADFTVSIVKPEGFDVSVSPAAFSLEPGASQALRITVSRVDAAFGSYSDGSITWSSSAGTATRIPLVARAVPLKYPAEIRVKPKAASLSYNVQPDWTGSLSTLVIGLQPPRIFAGTVMQSADSTVDITIPAGGRQSLARFALFQDDLATPTTNVGFAIYKGSQQLAVAVNDFAGDRQATLLNPAAGAYTIYIALFDANSTETPFKLHFWMLRLPSPGSSNTVSQPTSGRPASVSPGQTVPVSLTFNSRLMQPADKRYFGAVLYGQQVTPEALKFNSLNNMTLITLG